MASQRLALKTLSVSAFANFCLPQNSNVQRAARVAWTTRMLETLFAH
jgi:hypothetical protein